MLCNNGRNRRNLNGRTKGLRKKPLALLILGCSTAANVTWAAFSESKNPFPYTQHQHAFQKLGVDFFVILLYFPSSFGQKTEEHLGHLKYDRNVTVSLQFAAQFWSCVSTSDNPLQK